MNRKNNRANRAPLRRVVDWETLKGICVETLECGHKQHRKKDIYGETNAVRRRCRKCERGIKP